MSIRGEGEEGSIFRAARHDETAAVGTAAWLGAVALGHFDERGRVVAQQIRCASRQQLDCVKHERRGGRCRAFDTYESVRQLVLDQVATLDLCWGRDVGGGSWR